MCVSCVVELYLGLYLIIWKDTLVFGLKEKPEIRNAIYSRIFRNWWCIKLKCTCLLVFWRSDRRPDKSLVRLQNTLAYINVNKNPMPDICDFIKIIINSLIYSIHTCHWYPDWAWKKFHNTKRIKFEESCRKTANFSVTNNAGTNYCIPL